MTGDFTHEVREFGRGERSRPDTIQVSVRIDPGLIGEPSREALSA